MYVSFYYKQDETLIKYTGEHNFCSFAFNSDLD